MKPTKTLVFAAACLSLGVGFVAGSLFGASRTGDGQNHLSDGQEQVLLQGAELAWTDDGLTVSGDAVQLLNETTGANEAAVADGACTQEQVDEHACLSNPFYLRDLGYRLTLPVADSATLETIDYSDPELAMREVPFTSALTGGRGLPFLIRASIENGRAIKISEVYVP